MFCGTVCNMIAWFDNWITYLLQKIKYAAQKVYGVEIL